MAYQCTKTNKECDGCGDCGQVSESCPNCGETGFEVKYYIGIEWIGCSECIKREIL